MPMFSNIWRENSGKLAAIIERQNVFAAMAEAALLTMLDDDKWSRGIGNTHNMR